MELLEGASAQDTRGQVWVESCPRNSKGRHLAIQLPFCQIRQLLYLFNRGLSLGALQLRDKILEEVRVCIETRSLGYAVIVLARKNAELQRRPDRRSISGMIRQSVRRLVIDNSLRRIMVVSETHLYRSNTGRRSRSSVCRCSMLYWG